MTPTVWVPLCDALWIALYGYTQDDCEPQPGALLHGLKRFEIPAARRDFDIALSEAALNAAVHFEGRHPAGALPEPIPSTYFIEPCGFNTDGSITPFPYNAVSELRPRPGNGGITWTNVAVSRSEFFKWLPTAFPTTGNYLGVETAGDIPANSSPGSDSEPGLVQNTKKNFFSKQELLKDWLREKFDGGPVPEPKFECRKDLINSAINDIQKLRGKCDEATMKKAIDSYNTDIRNDPKRSDRNRSD